MLDLVDTAGRPIELHTGSNPYYDLHQQERLMGWVEVNGTSPAISSSSHVFEHRTIKMASRVAYRVNTLMANGVTTVLNFALGDEFTYSEMPDKRAFEAFEEFWIENDFDSFSRRIALQWLTDGEVIPIWAKEDNGASSYPAYIELAEPINTTVEARSPRRADKINTNTEDGEYLRGQDPFVYVANEALYNTVRGVPHAYRAIYPALRYSGLIEARMRAHDLQGRINAVYKALVNASANDGGLTQQQQAANVFAKVPKDGSVAVIKKDIETGHDDEFEFTAPGGGAKDSREDLMAILSLFSSCFGLPAHYFSDGATANLATASTMSEPTRKSIMYFQGVFRVIYNQIYRMELLRRFGENQTYKIESSKVTPDGLSRVTYTRRVKAKMLEFPFQFSRFTEDDPEAVNKRAEIALKYGLATDETVSTWFGIDPLAERAKGENTPIVARRNSAAQQETQAKATQGNLFEDEDEDENERTDD